MAVSADNDAKIIAALKSVSSKTPIMALTSLITLSNATEAVDSGAATYLLKIEAEPGILAAYLNIISITKKYNYTRRFINALSSGKLAFSSFIL